MNEAAAIEVVCALSRPGNAPSDQAAYFNKVANGLGWTSVLQAAHTHDVASLYVHRLCSLEASQLNGAFREGLQIFLEGERLSAQSLSGELMDLLRCLASLNIPVIPFKGPRLARDIYGDDSLRVCRDLDILMRDADVDQALAGLIGLGYRQNPELNTRQIAAVRRYGGQYILFHPDRAPVEPHWRFAPSTLAFDLDYDRIWRRARGGAFCGVPCLTMSPEDELLLLCLHGAKERWRGLKWIFDVGFFVAANPQIDWPRLNTEAAEQGCARMLHLGLALAARVLHVDLPAEAEGWLREDPKAVALASEVVRRLANTTPYEHTPYRLSRFYWQMRERWRDRWRYVARTVFTPRSVHHGLIALPQALSAGYYPIKLVWDYLIIPTWIVTKRVRD